jgi:N-acetylglucosaminyldiphosphoundecaprenol N-acetyl-beta-D-mannosaminyltransferase
MNTPLSTVTVRGLPFVDADQTELNKLLRMRLQRGDRTVIFTPNAKMGGDALRDARLYTLLCRADLLLPDGAGVLLAARRARTPLPERIAGIDFGEALLLEAEKRGLRVFLLGGKEGIASRAGERICRRYPKLKLAGTCWGYFSEREQREVLHRILATKPDILFVCLGFPMQEKWIAEHRHEINAKLILGLGGTLDVFAGTVKRAPKFFVKANLEWFYRLIKEPRRIGRMMKLPKFIFGAIFIKEKD